MSDNRLTPSNSEHIDHDMIKIEVNLDDISGEWLGYVMDLLFQAGANDVFYTPIYMKKNRPGVLLQVLCSIELLDSMENILFQETTTLGIRYYPLTVHRMERKFIKVSTQWGDVAVKQGIYKGKLCSLPQNTRIVNKSQVRTMFQLRPYMMK